MRVGTVRFVAGTAFGLVVGVGMGMLRPVHAHTSENYCVKNKAISVRPVDGTRVNVLHGLKAEDLIGNPEDTFAPYVLLRSYPDWRQLTNSESRRFQTSRIRKTTHASSKLLRFWPDFGL